MSVRFQITGLDNYVKEWRASKENDIIDALDYVGKHLVVEARDNGDYHDRTNNLRSSIGFIVVQDGNIVRENFEISSIGNEGGGEEGMASAQSFALELASEYNNGIVLIVMAGMNYTAYVENGHYYKVNGEVRKSRPYNVLSSAEILASELVPKILRDLKLIK